MLEGTTLTLPALIFVAFAYETSDLTWRDIPRKFCLPEDRIAHSTLYTAVHGLGKSLLEQEARVREGIEKLRFTYLPPQENSPPDEPRQKSLYDHTRERESAAHTVLWPLVYCCRQKALLARVFFTYLRPLRLIFSTLDPPVRELYPRQSRPAKK